MVSDRIEGYLNRLVEKTKNRKIKWRPIKEYIDAFCQGDMANSGITQYIEICLMEWSDLHYDKSFFVQKDGYTLALLNYTEFSGEDDSTSERLELVGGIYNSPVKRFPEYIEGGFAKIQDAILEYWASKEGDYNVDISDNFEILSVFTEED